MNITALLIFSCLSCCNKMRIFDNFSFRTNHDNYTEYNCKKPKDLKSHLICCKIIISNFLKIDFNSCICWPEAFTLHYTFYTWYNDKVVFDNFFLNIIKRFDIKLDVIIAPFYHNFFEIVKKSSFCSPSC